MASVDHPSYLTRQVIFVPKSTAGANTVQAQLSFPADVRIRNMVASVVTAGTATTATVVAYCPGTSVQYPTQTVLNAIGTNSLGATGTAITSVTTNTTTTTLGSITLTTNTAGVVLQSGDANAKVPVGQTLVIKNGADATSAYGVTIEYYVDPGFNAWTGSN